VGAERQPAQDELGADDGERVSFERAVQSRQHHDAARLHQKRNKLEEGRHIGHVLDNFKQQHRIEAAALRGNFLCGRGSVVDCKPRAFGVSLGGLDVLRRGIDTGDRGAEPGHGLGHQPSAAADIEDRKACEARWSLGIATELFAELVADIGEPHRIDAMQRPERSFGVPPVACELGKPRNLVPIERAAV
jgi:hypothetical protein